MKLKESSSPLLRIHGRPHSSRQFLGRTLAPVVELAEAGRPTAAGRINDALQALSRRPEPDAAGAISHAIAALECVAGDITGNDKATFGDVLKSHPELFPGGLKKGLEGIWGYSCNEGPDTARKARSRSVRRPNSS